MQLSSFAEKIRYASDTSSNGMRCVISAFGSMMPFCTCSIRRGSRRFPTPYAPGRPFPTLPRGRGWLSAVHAEMETLPPSYRLIAQCSAGPTLLHRRFSAAVVCITRRGFGPRVMHTSAPSSRWCFEEDHHVSSD